MACSAIVSMVALLAFSVSGQEIVEPSDVGKWTVGDCILAQFAMTFHVHPNASNPNITDHVDVPADAEVVKDPSSCGKTVQLLQLSWKDPAPNATDVSLERNLTIRFALKPNDTFYGVDRIYGSFEWGKYVEVSKDNKTVEHISVLNVDTQTKDHIAFHTPMDRSYLCKDIGIVHLTSNLMYDYLNFPPSGIKLANATMGAQHVQFDAFRTHDTKPEGYRTPVDCDYQPNDVVPIAVGVALAGLVVAVLVAYMVGRRRHRQRGYESV